MRPILRCSREYGQQCQEIKAQPLCSKRLLKRPFRDDNSPRCIVAALRVIRYRSPSFLGHLGVLLGSLDLRHA